ncbi:MAG: YwiC-like family protein [Acidobacteria bacterium]|nr:YwiC-like family protein [Acidobacteriota bacterium]
MTRKLLLPREHGAWGMMLQPFVAGAILAREWHWSVIPALAAVMGVFVMRESLLVIARQKYIWRELKPETADAKWSLMMECAALVLCGLLLLTRVPLAVLASLGVAVAALTAIAVYMALRNRQRSVALQSLSAFGLSVSAVIAGYAATGAWQRWMLPLIVLHGLHSLSGIFAVHTRLDAMAAARNPEKLGAAAIAMRRKTVVLQGINIVVAAGLALSGNALLALPVVLSVLMAASELWRLSRPDALKEPLKRVGWRSLAMAVTHTVVTIAVLW